MTDIVDDEVHELVIIKHRLGHDEEEHHGGVWKIAYADFMTAMMAFFLVLWLLNSTNKEAKISIKNYFNPVKLADASMTRKGIIDPKDAKPGAAPTMGQKVKADAPGNKHGDSGIFPKSNEPATATKSGDGGKSADGGRTGTGVDIDARPRPSGSASDAGSPNYSETALFQDPYRILAEIVSKAPAPTAARPGKQIGEVARPASRAPQPYRDPFESTPQAAPVPPVPTPPKVPAAKPAPAVPAVAQAPPAKPVLAEAAKDSPGAVIKEAAKFHADLIKALGGMADGKPAPEIEVKATKEGVLISLTDKLDFGMFSIGSAQPRPKLISIMEKIAALLKTKPGAIVIRGHTDARPYKSSVYDNWRLSSDRAQMARFMLVRGGLEDKRFAAIEGDADRDPKVPSDPMAAANRRIEILLRRDTP